MLFLLLCIQTAVPALCEPRPAPPHNVHVDGQLLRWTPAAEGGTAVTYTVQYCSNVSLDRCGWQDVAACVHTPQSSCNVASARAQGEHGCVLLRVHAERGGLTSSPASACSPPGDPCTPEPTLTARPGTLTVHLSRKHSFAQENADNAQHMVYFGKEGESLKTHTIAISSVSIHDLQEGQRYCTQVQYVYTGKPVGPASCTQCQLIPQSKPQQSGMAAAGGLGGAALLAVIAGMLYVLLFHHDRIKEWLRPPYEIPEDFLLSPCPEHYIVSISTPSDEQCDVISCINPKEFAD